MKDKRVTTYINFPDFILTSLIFILYNFCIFNHVNVLFYLTFCFMGSVCLFVKLCSCYVAPAGLKFVVLLLPSLLSSGTVGMSCQACLD